MIHRVQGEGRRLATRDDLVRLDRAAYRGQAGRGSIVAVTTADNLKTAEAIVLIVLDAMAALRCLAVIEAGKHRPSDGL